MKTVTVEQVDKILKEINAILAGLDERLTALEEANKKTRAKASA